MNQEWLILLLFHRILERNPIGKIRTHSGHIDIRELTADGCTSFLFKYQVIVGFGVPETLHSA